MQTSSTLADCGPEEWPPGLAVIACWVAGLEQPAMARMAAAPDRDRSVLVSCPALKRVLADPKLDDRDLMAIAAGCET